ncbi:hypothetical protein BKH43_07045 [Helicobacter sp. 13S00401-1]|uniref:MarC family protein n=1 Tax=Helicobacter sp. 13S00401-1 TaxID=1905758 RepID=UPI000BA5EC30|nr:MarC family protein [Helicobacter sp. 13S00401-1]PAF49331.1 hypothetical protein BKH43_07045 [Helicobacter sp. 13S00401-1]
MEMLYSFVQLVVFAFLALFPVINPIGISIILEPFFSTLSEKDRKYAAKRIALNCFFICIVALFIGSWILKLFGLSIPVIQIAGGILIIQTGLKLMNSKDSASTKKIEPNEQAQVDATDEKEAREQLNKKLFYPYSFPIMIDAGTISVLFTLAAQGDSKLSWHYVVNMGAIIIGVIAMMLLAYVFLSKTHTIVSRLGGAGVLAISKVAAFLILGVGVEIFASGVMSFIKPFFPTLMH